MNKAEKAKLMRLNPYQRHANTLGTGHDHWTMATAIQGATWADFIVKIFRAGKLNPFASHQYSDDKLDKALKIPKGNLIYAEINHSRWIGICECGGAEVVAVGMPFYCFSCFNVISRGRSRPVRFPKNSKQIEETLLARPVPTNRNFHIGETLEDLERENVAHNLPKQIKRRKK